MHELYELKEKLCKELKKYSEEDVSASSLEVIDKLSHSIKNLDKIIEKYEEEDDYSMRSSYGSSYNSYESSYGNSNRGGGSSRGGGNSNASYARGRGRNARRDSRGRYSSEGGYSRNGDIVEELREMMMDAPDEQTRQEYQKVIQKLEMM